LDFLTRFAIPFSLFLTMFTVGLDLTVADRFAVLIEFSMRNVAPADGA